MKMDKGTISSLLIGMACGGFGSLVCGELMNHWLGNVIGTIFGILFACGIIIIKHEILEAIDNLGER